MEERRAMAQYQLAVHSLGLLGDLAQKIVNTFLEDSAQSPQRLAESIKHDSLNPHAYSADLYKSAFLKSICTTSKIKVTKDVLTEKSYQPSREVNIEEACKVLSNWSNVGNSDDRGSLLWDAFWNRLEKIPDATFYLKHFSTSNPLKISQEINTSDKNIPEAFGAAVLAFEQKGIALNATRGRFLYVQSGETRIPFFGGCADV